MAWMSLGVVRVVFVSGLDTGAYYVRLNQASSSSGLAWTVPGLKPGSTSQTDVYFLAGSSTRLAARFGGIGAVLTAIRVSPVAPGTFTCPTRALKGWPACALFRVEAPPKVVSATPELPVDMYRNAAAGLARYTFENLAETIRLAVTF